MTGTQITLEELCTSCNHDNDDCDRLRLWKGLDFDALSYYCSNHLPKTEAATEDG